MNMNLLKLIACLIVLGSGLLLNGCATANGFGEDVQGAGKDIQHAANDN